MSYEINKVAVLGAGVMGQGIAAHLANARIESVLYDINLEAAQAGLESAVKAKPAGSNTSLFFKKSDASLITAATYDDAGAALLAECDLVIEVVVERLDIKHKVFGWVAEHRRPGSVVASNTSGLSIAEMSAPMSQEMREHFLVMHFFNPVRYMRLLELVQGEHTSQAVVDAIAAFGERRLGKGIVFCKDTPNFIGNRVGTYGMCSVFHHMPSFGLNVSEIDGIFGKAMGRPKSACFRTGDLVGIDTLAHVIKTVYDSCPDDPDRDKFVIPTWIQSMVDEGSLGGKTGKGFYFKTKVDGKKAILSRNVETGEYEDQGRPRFDSVKAAKKGGTKALLAGSDKAAGIAWAVTADTLLYTAGRIPEIADDIVNIDRAMRWGYGWDAGIFEGWDAIGVAESVQRMVDEGRTVPAWVNDMLAAGRSSFYARVDGVQTYWCALEGKAKVVPQSDGWLILDDLKRQSGTVAKNASADLLDLGDGVLGLSFHSKMNALDADIFTLYDQGLNELDEGKWEALVIGNQGGPAFCAGANIFMLVMLAMQQEWDQIEGMVKGMQDTLKRAQYSRRPVVTAPRGLTLGGGLEVAMQSSACQAGGELYAGLVEVGVGIVPGWGGCKEMLARLSAFGIAPNGPMGAVMKAFEMIGTAQIAKSAEQARRMGFLRPDDRVSMNRDLLLADAKARVLELADDYTPPEPHTYHLPGATGRAALDMAVSDLSRSGQATPHDVIVTGELANILTGGDTDMLDELSEDDILAMELAAISKLSRNEATLARMEHMVQTGKPLRN